MRRPIFTDRSRRTSAAFQTHVGPQDTGARLGYDPCPDVRFIGNNWQPPAYHPLLMTPELRQAALCVWWNGPPWAILRNASFFLWRVWDYGRESDRDYAAERIPEAHWIRAIDDAVPGEVSRGVVSYWGRRLGRIKDDEFVNWPDRAHLHDCRPYAGMSLRDLMNAMAESRGDPLPHPPDALGPT